MADTPERETTHGVPTQVNSIVMPRQDEETTNNTDPIGEASHLLQRRNSADSERLPSLEGQTNLNDEEDDDYNNESSADDTVHVRDDLETKSSWYMFLLTLSMGGLQIAWSVETSNFSPYLLSLGISKSFLAIIWVAGPLAGVLVQPYVGVKSDQCRSRLGRRRPFMIGGAIATAVTILILAWTKEIIIFTLHDVFGAASDSAGVKASIIVLAIVMVYILDCAINVVQAAIRAFIVDNAPTHQQDTANAWASRATGVGNIIGYLFGRSDLPSVLWFFGNTQFKVLCVIAALALLITVAISCVTIHEPDPRLENLPAENRGGLLDFFSHLYGAVRNLPPQIKSVCVVQFFAWIGWFPFLFYITTYIGEIYVEPIFAERPDMPSDEIDAVWQQATRIGTQALFVFAITSFVASVLLPFIVARVIVPSDRTVKPTADSSRDLHSNGFSKPFSTKPHISALVERISHLTDYIPSTTVQWLTLRRAWMMSHLLFALLMGLTFLVRSTSAGTVLVAAIGIPWAMTNWAPFALIATEIGKRDPTRRGITYCQVDQQHDQAENQDEGTDQAGIVLGIHNVAISAPQILATLVSSIIFRTLQKPRGSVGDDSVAWVLRFGGLAALIAAWCCRKVQEESVK